VTVWDQAKKNQPGATAPDRVRSSGKRERPWHGAGWVEKKREVASLWQKLSGEIYFGSGLATGSRIDCIGGRLCHRSALAFIMVAVMNLRLQGLGLGQGITLGGRIVADSVHHTPPFFSSSRSLGKIYR